MAIRTDANHLAANRKIADPALYVVSGCATLIFALRIR